MSKCHYIKSNCEVRFFHSSFLSEQTGHANSQSSAEIDCRSIEKVASSTVHLEEASSVNMFIIFQQHSKILAAWLSIIKSKKGVIPYHQNSADNIQQCS
mmetsp:Transcript_12389/g.15983  ORF Transcript_12389/g.15983 Transcript_12389/m.15983 type:complete len:99 (+) Transcript_12389:1343-1639(+)